MAYFGKNGFMIHETQGGNGLSAAKAVDVVTKQTVEKNMIIEYDICSMGDCLPDSG